MTSSRPQLASDFLMNLATVLSRYPDFWEGAERTDFVFTDKFIKRLRGFKVSEYVQKRQPREILFEIIRKRLNLDPLFEDTTKQAAE